METPELPQKTFPKNMLLMGIVLVVIIICLGVTVIYLLFTKTQVLDTSSNNNNSEDDTEIENDNTDVTVEEETTYEWVGNATTATLPTDWSVVEYTTAEGMEMYADEGNMTFDGITGIEVYNESDDLVFSVKGVSGIGGTEACSELAVFGDTTAAYITSIEDGNSMVGMPSPNIIDLSNSEYSDISFLGETFRRVDNELYLDMDNNANTFSTGCGINGSFVVINQIAFVITGSNTINGNSYTYEIESNIVDEDTLTKLDDVLNSFVAY